MYIFGNNSLQKLETAALPLQFLAKKAIIVSTVDFGIIHGHREKALQNSLFRTGHSKVVWPNSLHNSTPAEAIDFAVWDANQRKFIWAPLSYYYYLYGVFDSIANENGIKIRSGLNWDSDWDFEDQLFLDGGHIELDEE